jgi:hypothetical protein
MRPQMIAHVVPEIVLWANAAILLILWLLGISFHVTGGLSTPLRSRAFTFLDRLFLSELNGQRFFDATTKDCVAVAIFFDVQIFVFLIHRFSDFRVVHRSLQGRLRPLLDFVRLNHGAAGSSSINEAA